MCSGRRSLVGGAALGGGVRCPGGTPLGQVSRCRLEVVSSVPGRVAQVVGASSRNQKVVGLILGKAGAWLVGCTSGRGA